MRKLNKSLARGDRRAFTLMEVVVAVIIVGMTAIATLSTFAADFRTAVISRSALEAASLARDRVTALELIPAEDLVALPDSSRKGQFKPPFDKFDWTATASSVLNETDLFDATVRVTWEGGDYSVATRLYRPVSLVSR